MKCLKIEKLLFICSREKTVFNVMDLVFDLQTHMLGIIFDPIYGTIFAVQLFRIDFQFMAKKAFLFTLFAECWTEFIVIIPAQCSTRQPLLSLYENESIWQSQCDIIIIISFCWKNGYARSFAVTFLFLIFSWLSQFWWIPFHVLCYKPC